MPKPRFGFGYFAEGGAVINLDKVVLVEETQIDDPSAERESANDAAVAAGPSKKHKRERAPNVPKVPAVILYFRNRRAAAVELPRTRLDQLVNRVAAFNDPHWMRVGEFLVMKTFIASVEAMNDSSQVAIGLSNGQDVIISSEDPAQVVKAIADAMGCNRF